MFKKLLWLMVLAVPALAQNAAVQGHSFLGGVSAVTSGLKSSNYLNGIIPSATITVYLTGTQNKATIYSDASGTPLGNPFTSNASGSVNPGGWLFFAAVNQGYDVVGSGGIAPNIYPVPVTLCTDCFAGGGSGGSGPFLPLTGGTLTGALFGTTVSASVNAVINVKAAPYNATGNGTTDDTTAIQAAIAAAKIAGVGSTPGALYFPVGTYLISSTLDVSGMDVGCAGKFQSTIKMSSTVQQDVFQTKGNTKIHDCGINGGWDGSTTGLSGNGISTLSSPGAGTPYYGYQNVFSNLYILDTKHDCIYINDGAYESLEGVKCNASGLDGLYIDSGNYSGYQTTTTNVSGQSTFSDMPNGYGIVINDGIDISFTGLTTLENTTGIEILGGTNRNISFLNVYQEGNAGKWLTAVGSAGIGLNVENDYGPGTTGTTYADVSGWTSYSFANNDFSNPGSRTVPLTILGSTNVDTINALYGDWTFNTSTATPLGIAPVTAAAPWNASFTGNWNNSAVHSKPAQTIEISNTNPTITVGTTIFTFSLSSGGIFQGMVTTPGSGTGAYEFLGSIEITSDKQESTNSNLALQTADGIQAGVLNATTGYQIGGAAPSGHCLVGNGTDYVDGSCGGGGGGALLLSPGSGVTQTVAQQAGTSANINILNGSYYAAQFGTSSTGIASAITAGCTGTGCDVIAGSNYANTELLPAIVRGASGYGTGNYLAMPNWPGLTHVEDIRAGFDSHIFNAPTGTGSYYPSATGPQFISGMYFNSAYNVTIPGNTVDQQTSITQSVFNGLGNQINGFGGVNLKSYDFGPVTTMISSDQGQHIGEQHNLNCYGVGDCVGGANEIFVVDDGGASTYNDEGAHAGDLQVGEDLNIFEGTISSTPASGATTFQSTVTAAAGTQGNGRYIIDKTAVTSGSWPSEYVSATVFNAGQSPPMETFVGTSFTTGWVAMVCDPAVDTCNNGLDPTGKVNSVAGGYAPGPVTFTIVTSAPSMRVGYSTSTSGLPTTGIACVADSEFFETTTYTVVSSSTITINLRKPHFDGMTVGIGGECQTGLEVTGGTYTIGGKNYRQVWPVVGNFNGTQLIVWDHDSQQGYSNAVLGNNGTAYCSTDSSPANFSFTGTGPYTVTAIDSPATNADPRFAGQTAIVTTGNSTYNGTVAISYTTVSSGGTWQPAYKYSLATSPSGTAPTSGTIQFCNTGFNLYPALEVLSVLNPSTTTVDGYFSVAPNSIVGSTAFLNGHSIEEPHYFWQSDTFSGGLYQISQMMPRAPLNDWQTAGLNYQNLMSGGYLGWSIVNSSPITKYQYYGGTAPAAQAAYFTNGNWKYGLEMHTPPSIGGAIIKLDAEQPSPYGVGDPLNSPIEIFQGPSANDRIYDNPYTGSFVFVQPIQIGNLGFPNTIYIPLFGTFAFSRDLGSSFTPDATIEAKYFQLYGTTPPTNYLNLEFYGESSTGIGMQFPSADGGTHQTYQGGTLSVGGLRFYFPNTVDASKTAGISVNSTTGDMSLDGATAGDAGANVFLKNLTLNGGTTLTGQSSANSQIVTCPTGGTTTQYCDAAGAWVAPGTGNTTSTSLTTNSLPKANGANSLINSLFSDNGTTGSYSGGGGFSVTGGPPGVATPVLSINGTTFTASGCSNSTLVGGATAGSFDSGTTGTCTVTITMGLSVTAPNGFACFANDITTPADVIHETAFTTTTATLSGTTVTGDVINFACTGY